MYMEKSSRGHGNKVFISFERTDILQIFKLTFYYNRFSSSNPYLRATGRFGAQLLLANDSWSPRYVIPKNDQYSQSPTDWKIFSSIVTVEIYRIKVICDPIDTPHSDMCLSNITITHSV